jgi:hypothetical protein
MNRLFLGCLLAAVILEGMAFAANGTKGVQVVADEAHQRVDITIDGAPFTSYVWPSTLKKPVLFPVITSDGIDVVRGFPLAPRPGERVDHPHHAGIWFNYGNVNGFDFWNNSDAIKPADREKMGTITSRKSSPPRAGETLENWSSTRYGPQARARTFCSRRPGTFSPGIRMSESSTR